MLAIDRDDQHPLEHEAEGAADEHRGERGEQHDAEIGPQRVGCRPGRQRRQHQRGDIGAERDEGAMAEIEHVHQAEHQRQPGGHGEDHHAHREAGDGERGEGRDRADEGRGDRDDEQRRQAGRRSRRWRGSAAPGSSALLVRIQGQAEQAAVHTASAASAPIRPWWTMRPPSITRTWSPTSWATRKFCSTSRIVTPVRLISRRQSIGAPMIAGARPLVGSSISSSRRGSTIARAIDSICFWPPDSVPARDSQNFRKAGKKPKIHSTRGRRAARRGRRARDCRAR